MRYVMTRSTDCHKRVLSGGLLGIVIAIGFAIIVRGLPLPVFAKRGWLKGFYNHAEAEELRALTQRA
jgi:hypothetical protein